MAHRFAVKYLVDANVLSESTRPIPDAGVVDWLRRNEPQIAIDPIILGELRFGILLLPAGKKRDQLETWFLHGIRRLQCLPWEAATVCAGLDCWRTSAAASRLCPSKIA